MLLCVCRLLRRRCRKPLQRCNVHDCRVETDALSCSCPSLPRPLLVNVPLLLSCDRKCKPKTMLIHESTNNNCKCMCLLNPATLQTLDISMPPRNVEVRAEKRGSYWVALPLRKSAGPAESCNRMRRVAGRRERRSCNRMVLQPDASPAKQQTTMLHHWKTCNVNRV